MSNGRINWLESWLPMNFEFLNPRGVRRKKDHVEIIVRAHLHKMDEQDRENPNVKHSIEFEWDKISDPDVEPEMYVVRAFLNPPAVRTNGGGAGGLKPTPPPQPPPPPIDP